MQVHPGCLWSPGSTPRSQHLCSGEPPARRPQPLAPSSSSTHMALAGGRGPNHFAPLRRRACCKAARKDHPPKERVSCPLGAQHILLILATSLPSGCPPESPAEDQCPRGAFPPLQHQGKPQPEPGLTSATLSSSGSSQCSLHSQWLSRNVRTRAWAASAPRTRERIRPAEGVRQQVRGCGEGI